MDRLLPFAAVVAVATGFALLSSEATTMAANPAFRVKIVALGAVAGNALGFQFGARRSLEAWAGALPPPPAARIAGLIAIVGWIVAVAAARLIAFS